jgi:hypothetical protein
MSDWQDSNLRPPAPKAGALAKLRYSRLGGQIFDETCLTRGAGRDG